MCFINKYRPSGINYTKSESLICAPSLPPYLTVPELLSVKLYWVRHSQKHSFPDEVASYLLKRSLPDKSCIFILHPLLDSKEVIRVGGRKTNALIAYSQRHPIIPDGKHCITKLIIHSEHAAFYMPGLLFFLHLFLTVTILLVWGKLSVPSRASA